LLIEISLEKTMAVATRVCVVVVCLAALNGMGGRLWAHQDSGEKTAAVAGKQDSGKKQSIAGKQAAKGKPEAKPKEAAPPKAVTAAVVFSGGTAFVDKVKESCTDLRSEKLQDCFAEEMKKAGATVAAVEFSKQLGEPGFARDFKAAGPVDVVYVLYPYRANENQSWLVVNGEPAIVDVDSQKTVALDTLKKNAGFVALTKAHPKISLWPGDRNGIDYPDVEMGANHGVHILVNYRLREDCHACAVEGHAWYALEFDAKGKYGGAKLLATSAVREKAGIARNPGIPVATAVGEEFTIGLPVRAGGESEWMMTRALDTMKVRLIERSHVAPPSATGGAGTDELWKFAGMGVGSTEIEFQKMGEKKGPTLRYRVVIRAGKK
jgi:hypothetical protein